MMVAAFTAKLGAIGKSYRNNKLKKLYISFATWRQTMMSDDKANLVCMHTSFCKYICYAGLRKRLKTATLKKKKKQDKTINNFEQR